MPKPPWYLWENPNVSLTALDSQSWYTHISLQGRVVELLDDPELADIDRIAKHYTGSAYRGRDRKRVSAWIEVDHWHGWSGGAPLSVNGG